MAARLRIITSRRSPLCTWCSGSEVVSSSPLYGFGSQVQPGEDDLPEVLRPPAPPSYELQKEEVWTQQPAPPQEEDQVERWFCVLVQRVQHKVIRGGLTCSMTTVACWLPCWL